MTALPPGATVRLVEGELPSASVPVWLYWARIAQYQAAEARAAQVPDERVSTT
jgi:hypothetical protein